jgi:uroporphyrinogen-III synthase
VSLKNQKYSTTNFPKHIIKILKNIKYEKIVFISHLQVKNLLNLLEISCIFKNEKNIFSTKKSFETLNTIQLNIPSKNQKNT